MGVSFKAATQNSSQVVERPLSPINKPRLGREGGLCSGVTLMGLAWAEFRGQAAVQSNEAGLCGLLKETPPRPFNPTMISFKVLNYYNMRKKEKMETILVGVDTGGTFTDFIHRDGNQWKIYKTLSTPDNPAMALLEGFHRIGQKKAKGIVHGSTVATNAILERKGVKTALITNRGFEDVVEIGRQGREKLYDLAWHKGPPLVPAPWRFGIKGRVTVEGTILEDLDEVELADLAKKLKHLGAESVAVCLLFSFINPAHEKKVRLILEQAGLTVYISSEVLPEFREFERTSTTTINAYVSPIMDRYISFIEDNLNRDDSFLIMQSNGGSISALTAINEGVRTIFSGPAGGVVGAFETGKLAGFTNLISFDMGGTSTDVSLVDGELNLTTETVISGYPVRVPTIDIHTVGAGGGSIAYVDAGGSLRVGPQSAGAEPGPICYGKGENITVTDANLFLGRLEPGHFLGGKMRLHPQRLHQYFERLGSLLGLTSRELAEGILDVANTAMERAIRVISVERGFDLREFSLFSFGGAGGMHAAFLAKMLDIPCLLIPPNPGILSAIGMLMADVIKDYSQTVMIPQHEISSENLLALFAPFEDKARQDLIQEGVDPQDIVLEPYLDMRYQGQSFELIVPFKGDCVIAFHEKHKKTYGYQHPDRPVEIINVRLLGRGKREKPTLLSSEFLSRDVPETACVGEKMAIFSGREISTSIFAREKLLRGNTFDGPAIVVEYSSTTVVPPLTQCHVDAYGNLILEIG